MPIQCRAERLQEEIGHANVLTDRAQPRTYECDRLAVYKGTLALVALPDTTEQVRACVRACVEEGVPYVAGYDFGKLLAGSYGIFGVVTEVASRLHPLPGRQRSVGMASALDRNGGSITLAHTVGVLDASIRGDSRFHSPH